MVWGTRFRENVLLGRLGGLPVEVSFVLVVPVLGGGRGRGSGRTYEGDGGWSYCRHLGGFEGGISVFEEGK